MEKNTIITLKKKIICVLVVLIILCICIEAGAYWARRHCTMDWENGILTVRKDPWSGYSYKVYKDHVELVEYIGNKEKVRVPDRLMGKPVTVIKKLCFCFKPEMKTVHLGRNIRTIEDGAFAECFYLREVTGDAELEVISMMAFRDCSRLKRVDAGNRLKRIEASAFFGCAALESIGEQPELEYIGQGAFFDAGSLLDFQISEDTEVESCAFVGSRWLADLLEENQEEFVVLGTGTLVAYQGDSKMVEIPYGVTLVDGEVFTHSPAVRDIKEIYLSETVKEVETSAFEGCGIIRVYMPDSVTVLDALNLDAYPDTDYSWLGGKTTGITIVTTSGSYAEKYAKTKKYGVKYEIVEPWW